MIKKLEWDSNFFGYKIGELHFNEKEFSKSKIEDLDEFDLVYVFSKKKLISRCLSRAYTKVVFEFDLETFKSGYNKPRDITDIITEKVSNKERQKLFNLAYKSGKYSRFNLDKNFSNKEFRELYKKWIENSIKGRVANHILVFKNNSNVIVGFVTLSSENNKSNIGLIAVDDEFRGKGVGSKLIFASKFFSKNNNSKKLLVATQLDNKAACNFYLKNGFETKEKVNVYHLWRN